MRTFFKIIGSRQALSALILATCIIGCQKAITVEQQPYEERISIESLLQPGEIPKAFVARMVPFFENIQQQTPSSLFVPDAEVVILSDQGSDTLRPDSTYNRFFCRWEPHYIGSAPIRANTRYDLRVTHSGQLYTASTVTNVPVVSIDSVSYTAAFTDIFGGHEGVIVDFTDIPGQDNQYRFLTTRPLTNEHETTDDLEYSSECLDDGETVVVRETGRFVYFDDNRDGAPVRFVAEPAYTQFKDDPSTVYIQSLDEKAAHFYDTLDRQQEANINPFAEPISLYTNIEGTIGIFAAVNLSPPVHFVFPEDHIN